MSDRGGRRDHRRRLLVALRVVLAAAAAVVGVVLAATHPANGAHHHRHGIVFIIAFAGVAAALVAAWTGWLIHRINNRPTMQRLGGWDFAQRRATARAVQKGERLTADQRQLATAQLEHLSSTGRMQWVVLPVAVVAFIVNAVINSGGLRPLWIAVVALEVICLPALLWTRRLQLRRFQRALSQPFNNE